MITKFSYKIKNDKGLFISNKKPDVAWVDEKIAYTFTTYKEVTDYLKEKIGFSNSNFLKTNTFKDCHIVTYEVIEKNLFNLNEYFEELKWT